MKKVCVDASLALAWLLPAEENQVANALRREWDERGIELISPPLFHAEVTSVLRQQVYYKRLLLEEGEEAFSLYLDMDVRTVDHPRLQEVAWELAKRFHRPRTYDMQYLAVAELEGCELWTADRRLVNALRGRTSRVKWLGDYKPEES